MRRHPVHGPARRVRRAADPPRCGHGHADRNGRRRPGRRGVGRPGRVLREHRGAAGRHVRRSELRRAGGPGARDHLAALANQEVPFEQVVEAVNPVRSASRHPLFQVILPWTTATSVSTSAGCWSSRPGTRRTARSRRSSICRSACGNNGSSDEPAGVDGRLEFAAELFDRATAQAVVDRFVRLLSAVADEPECADRPARMCWEPANATGWRGGEPVRSSRWRMTPWWGCSRRRCCVPRMPLRWCRMRPP